MKILLPLIQFLFFIFSYQNVTADSYISEPYLETNELLINPDRGFYHQKGGNHTQVNELSIYRNDLTVFRLYYSLKKFEDKSISIKSLKNFENILQKAINENLTVIPRFYYTWGFEKGRPFKSPNQDMILKHIDQLAPIINRNKKAISFIEAGFIGAWGEWHSDQYGDKWNFKPFRKKLIKNLLEKLDSDIYIALRYAPDLLQMSDLNGIDRLGLSHDCPNYYNDSYPRSNADKKTIQAPQGGEVCQLEPRGDLGSKSSNFDKYYGCEIMLKYFDKYNFDVLNVSDWSGSNSRFLEQGCYDEIRDRLGYRYVLKKTRYIDGVLEFEVQNKGFGKSFKDRWVKVKIGEKLLDTNLNPKNWLSGGVFNESIKIGSTDEEYVELIIEDDIKFANIFENKLFLQESPTLVESIKVLSQTNEIKNKKEFDLNSLKKHLLDCSTEIFNSIKKNPSYDFIIINSQTIDIGDYNKCLGIKDDEIPIVFMKINSLL